MISAPPPLPSRRPQTGSQIPTSHPHSRKISITTPILPPLDDSHPGSPSELPSIPESNQAGPSRPKSRSTNSSSNISSSSASSSRSRLPLDGQSHGQGQWPEGRAYIDGSGPRRSPRTPLGNNHSRAPSYQNAYGAAYLPTSPPPTHPYSRARQPTEPRGNTTVLWAYTRLIGQFHPSNQYIPPDPLLPLRSLLLHQPVGSGSLSSPMDSSSNPDSAQHKRTSSRWQLSFGTGAIGHKTQPSLTGSLFGLAKELVTGGTGGTLEEERRRVWQMKDLPVLETARSLLGVDIRLKEGEAKECKSHSFICIANNAQFSSLVYDRTPEEPTPGSQGTSIQILIRPDSIPNGGFTRSRESTKIKRHPYPNSDMGKRIHRQPITILRRSQTYHADQG